MLPVTVSTGQQSLTSLYAIQITTPYYQLLFRQVSKVLLHSMPYKLELHTTSYCFNRVFLQVLLCMYLFFFLSKIKSYNYCSWTGNEI